MQGVVNLPVPPGAVTKGVTYLSRVLRWALRHPWAAAPRTWALLVVGVLAVALSCAVLGGPLLAVLVALLASVPAAALLGWRKLLKAGESPVVYVCQFTPATPGATEASLNHQQALTERFQLGHLKDAVELRTVPAALSETEAETLLDVSSAMAVVCGAVKASGSAATFSAVMLYPGGGEDAASRPDHVVEDQRSRATLAVRHSLPVDYRSPLDELVAERYEATHVEAVEATLLVRLADFHLYFDETAEAEKCVAAATELKAALAPRPLTHLEASRVRLKHPTMTRETLLALEQAGQAGANHADLWKMLCGYGLPLHAAKHISDRELLRFAKPLRAVSAGDLEAAHLRGLALMAAGKPEAALQALGPVAVADEYADDFDLQLSVGILAYNAERYEQARDAYSKAIELEETARGHLYLADSFLHLGELDVARNHYRKALFLQPDLVDAHRGYWWQLPNEEPDLVFDKLYKLIARLPPVRPGGHARRWRRRLYGPLLRWHYRRHPEDSRIHYMLGAHALLDGDLQTADERLQFAYDLLDGADLETLGRLVLVKVHQGDVQGAREAMQTLHDARSFDDGGPAKAEELEARVMNMLLPAVEEPGLVAEEFGVVLWELMTEVFDAEMQLIPALAAGLKAVADDG